MLVPTRSCSILLAAAVEVEVSSVSFETGSYPCHERLVKTQMGLMGTTNWEDGGAARADCSKG